jgi:putative DNA primase/helicase
MTGDPFEDAVRAAAQQADRADQPDQLALDQAVARLATLAPLDYDRVRAAEAKRLGARVGTLDAEVERRRSAAVVATAGQGQPLKLIEPEPWPEPVEGAALLDALVAAFERHLALPAQAADALALWVPHAHALDVAGTNPRLAITSPQKRCGKSTLIGMLSKLVSRALLASNITPAAVFRAIEAYRPCLLLDEADTFLGDNAELRGVLNSGHTRTSAFVIRSVGEDHEPRQFGTWCPMAIAAIGKLSATLMDRSIVIPMRRRRRDEPVARLRLDRTPDLDRLARMVARWVADHRAALGTADPEAPAALNDRAADNWRPLLAIADAAGGRWPERARAAALALSGEQEDDSAAVLLLGDIRAAFERRQADRLASRELVGDLVRLEDRPWADWKGKPLTTNVLARLLKPFKIVPGSIRVGATGTDTPKGYKRKQFEDAWARYLPAAEA